MAEVRIKDIDEHEIDTILAEDIDFEGRLTFTKPLMIKGKFKGEIKSTSALYIGEKAYVEAKTEAGVVSSKGTHKGDILGHARVELFSTAHVDGDITTPDFVMESGCKFNGYCNMSGSAHTTETPKAPQASGAPPASTVSPASPEQARPATGASPQQAQRPPQQQAQKPPQQGNPGSGQGFQQSGGGHDPSHGGGQR